MLDKASLQQGASLAFVNKEAARILKNNKYSQWLVPTRGFLFMARLPDALKIVWIFFGLVFKLPEPILQRENFVGRLSLLLPHQPPSPTLWALAIWIMQVYPTNDILGTLAVLYILLLWSILFFRTRRCAFLKGLQLIPCIAGFAGYIDKPVDYIPALRI